MVRLGQLLVVVGWLTFNENQNWSLIQCLLSGRTSLTIGVGSGVGDLSGQVPDKIY